MTRRTSLAFGIAALAGLALYSAHPPVAFWPASLLHAPLLVAALWLAKPRPARVAAIGAVTGIAAFAPMLTWLAAPAGPVAYALLVGVQVAWYALAAVLLRRWLRHPALPVIAGIVIAGMDAWRSIVPLNGFGWGAIAYAHVEGSWLLPVARVVGGHGITLLVVVASVAALVVGQAVWAMVAARRWDTAEQLTIAQRPAIGQLAGALLASALLVADPPPEAGTIDVLVAQGHDVRFWEQDVADRALHVAENLATVTLDDIRRNGAPDVVVWPENAIDRDPWTTRGQPLAAIIDEVTEGAGELIAGTTLDGPDPRSNRYVAVSRFVDGFDERERYTKRRLVPFGEYVPMRDLLDWYGRLDQVPRDAISGDGPHRLTTERGVPVAVVICFETLFSGVVRTNVLAGDEPAQLLLALTNDASFRISAEPDQHLAQSRLRAVETGRWVVHGALSGSSAFVDPDGGIHAATDLFAVDAIRRDVPLVVELTPFLRVGDLVGIAARIGLVALAAVSVVATVRRRLRIGGERSGDEPAAAGSGQGSLDSSIGNESSGSSRAQREPPKR